MLFISWIMFLLNLVMVFCVPISMGRINLIRQVYVRFRRCSFWTFLRWVRHLNKNAVVVRDSYCSTNHQAPRAVRSIPIAEDLIAHWKDYTDDASATF